jgi:acyl carrier protein
MRSDNLQSSSFETSTMSRSEIEERVIKVSEASFDKPGEITLETNFISDLGADSLDTVELILAIEEEFDIEVPDEESSKVTTVKDIVDYIEHKKNNSGEHNSGGSSAAS